MAKRSTGISRRQFLGTTAAATALTALPEWFRESSRSRLAAQETSPNERPRIALVGCGGMGTGDAKNAQRFGDIVAVCDVDAERLGKAAESIQRCEELRRLPQALR